MKNYLKKITTSVKNIYYYSNNERLIKHLRQKGFSIGENCQLFARKSLWIDSTRPFLISIGDNVIITKGVSIITHGYDWAVLKHVYKTITGSGKSVRIGNNIFIGPNSIIMPGTIIEDNVILAAGSVASGVLESNSVFAGVPAKKIMTLDTYQNKRKKTILNEVLLLTNEYIKKYNMFPSQEIFKEFFDLYIERDVNKFGDQKEYILSKVSPYLEEFLNSKGLFSSFYELEKYLKKQLKYDR